MTAGGYARYEQWLKAHNLVLTPLTPANVAPWEWQALAESPNSKNYAYGHGMTPRGAVARLCRTVREHERAKKANPNVFWTYERW